MKKEAVQKHSLFLHNRQVYILLFRRRKHKGVDVALGRYARVYARHLYGDCSVRSRVDA